MTRRRNQTEHDTNDGHLSNHDAVGTLVRMDRDGYSRRDMLRALGGLGMSMAAASSVLMAAQNASAATATATPKRGGKMRAVTTLVSAADTLDPAKAGLSGDYMRQAMFYNGLAQFDSALNPVPALAESITTADARVWILKLRKGVTFHDGKTLATEDVIYSLMRHKDPTVGSKAKTMADQFDSVTASGPGEITLTLTAPNADLPAMLAMPQFLIVQSGTKDFTTAVGTGPYVCQSFKPGVSAIGTRNPHFWKPGKPYLDELELLGISDKSARVNALLAGDVQLISMLPYTAVEQVKSAGCQVMETKSGLYTNLIMRQDIAPTNNPDFVLAIKYLMNREMMIKAALRGYGIVANDQPVPPFHKYYLKGLPQRPYDPDRAAFHIKKANLGGTKIPIVAGSGLEGAVELAQMMQGPAAKAGLNLDIQRVPMDGYWSNHWMKDPLGFAADNPRPTPDLVFTQLYKSDAPWNECHWQNPQFDQLLLSARGEKDDAKRKQMYGDMQTIVSEQCGVAIPAFLSYLDAASSRVGGLEPIPTGSLMGYQFSEYVWLNG